MKIIKKKITNSGVRTHHLRLLRPSCYRLGYRAAIPRYVTQPYLLSTWEVRYFATKLPGFYLICPLTKPVLNVGPRVGLGGCVGGEFAWIGGRIAKRRTPKATPTPNLIAVAQ